MLEANKREEEYLFLRRNLSVTENDYSQAISLLYDLALDYSPVGNAAAQVLLSTYKGSSFQMDLTALCALDLQYFDCAMTVLRGRVLLSKEPQNAIAGGILSFMQLEELWPELRNNFSHAMKLNNGH